MITSLLFENPWLLATCLGLSELVLIAIWWQRRSRTSARLVVAGLIAIPTLLLVNYGVRTPRERIIRLCRDLAGMVEKRDVASLEPHLADDFEAAGLNRASFLDRATKRLKGYRLDYPRLSGFKVTFPKERMGVAVFDAACRIQSPEGSVGRLLSRWKLIFRDRNGRWLITRIQTLPSPFSPIHDLRDWL